MVYRFWRLLRGLVLRSTPALELRPSTVFLSRDLCQTAPAVRRHRARLLEVLLRHDYSRQSGEFLVCNVRLRRQLVVTTCVVLFWCYAFSLDRHLHYIGYVRVCP